MTIHTKEAWDAIQSLRAIAQEFENGHAHRDEVDAAMSEVEKYYPGYQDAYVSWPSQIESVKTGLIPGSPEAEAIINAGGTAWYVKPVDSNALDAAAFLASPEGEKELQNIEAGISALTPGVLYPTGAWIPTYEEYIHLKNTPPLQPLSPELEAEFQARLAAFEATPQYTAALNKWRGENGLRMVDANPAVREAAWEALQDDPDFDLNAEDEDDLEARFVPGTPEFKAAVVQNNADAQSDSPELKASIAAMNGETLEEYQARLDAFGNDPANFTSKPDELEEPSFAEIFEAGKRLDEMRLIEKAPPVEIERAKQAFLSMFKGQLSIIDNPGQPLVFKLNLHPAEPKPAPLDAIFADNASEQQNLDDANKLCISTHLHSAISSITEARGRMSPEMYASPEIKEICNRLEVFTLDFDAIFADNASEQQN